MAPKSVDATITVDEQAIPSVPDSLVVPPFSVNIYSFPVR
jgi:hypothetical protein